MGNVRLRFPKRDEAQLAESLSTAQRAAALVHPKIEQLCRILLAGESARDQLTKPRWQAGYDLALGRALALQVRTAGYNAVLAQAKRGMEFEKEKSNTWILKPGDEFANTALQRAATKANEYLTRVVDEHPETPWAMLAAQELESPLGWQWTEGFTPLPDPNNNPGNGNARPRPNDRTRPQRPPRRDPPPL